MNIMDFDITDRDKYISLVKKCVIAFKNGNQEFSSLIKQLKDLQNNIKNNYADFELYGFIEDLKDYVNNDCVDLSDKRFIEGFGIGEISDYLFYVVLGKEKMLETDKVKVFLEEGRKLITDYCHNLMSYMMDIRGLDSFKNFKNRLVSECSVEELSFFFYQIDYYDLALLYDFSNKSNKKAIDSFCSELKNGAKEKVFKEHFGEKDKNLKTKQK